MAALVLRGDTDLGRESSVDELAGQLAICEKMGVKYMFLSPKHTSVSKEVAYERLRKAGDVAEEARRDRSSWRRIPTWAPTADVHLKTMRQINHPNVRVNFDTGNITFYNKGADAVAELKKVIDYVATVELKDHNGQLQTWNFPVLGTGVVDSPRCSRCSPSTATRGRLPWRSKALRARNGGGAATADIADSVKYVQSLGGVQTGRRSISKSIQRPDYVLLIGYFVLMLGIGLFFYRHMKGMKVFFSGGNKIPWWLSGVSFWLGTALFVTAFVFLFQYAKRKAAGETVRGIVVALACGVLTALAVTYVFEQLFYVRLP